MTTRRLEIDGHTVELNRAGKVLFPEDGITKADLADYLVRVAPVMLPHLAGRPLSFQRFPDGVGSEGFFQKNVPDYYPDWVRRVSLPKEGGSVGYALAENAATLAYLADQAVIAIHAGLAPVDRPRHPDRLVVDLDPPGSDFAAVIDAARTVKALLDDLAAPSFVMTTGSRGLHVVVPLDRRADFDAARDFAAKVADALASEHPDRLTDAQRKARRGDRIFLDVARNAYGQTAIAPYSPRARHGAPIAAPLDWDELGNSDLAPDRWTIRNIFRRLAQKQDPLRSIDAEGARVDRLHRRLADRG